LVNQSTSFTLSFLAFGPGSREASLRIPFADPGTPALVFGILGEPAAIPEPSAYAAFAGLIVLWVAGRRGRRN
jgi:hypothetical protein